MRLHTKHPLWEETGICGKNYAMNHQRSAEFLPGGLCWEHMSPKNFPTSGPNVGRGPICMPFTSVEPYRAYIDAFLDALDRAEEPDETWD